MPTATSSARHASPSKVRSSTPPSVSHPHHEAPLTKLQTCKTGDPYILQAARSQARSQFENGRAMPTQEAAGGISHALEIAKILRENVVQGTQVSEGGDRFSKSFFSP